ncbi:MAG: hypothetical protein WCR31_02035 [Treponema sp.]
MKKIIGLVAIAAMVATTAFADIAIDSWGRGLWYAAANANVNGDNEIVTGMGQSWGGMAPRTAIRAHGSSDNVGFNLDVFGNGDSISQGDNANVWVKPIQQIQLKLGKMDDNVSRGDAVWGLWNWARFGAVNSMAGEGFIFDDGDVTGAQIIAKPVEGLTFIVGLPLSLTSGSYEQLTTTLGHKAKYIAMYTIKDIGTVKAGVLCQDKAYDKDLKKVDYEIINAAFDLTAVKNLKVSLGAFIPTATVYNVTGTSKVVVPQINAYAEYAFNALTIHAAVGTKINQMDKKDGIDAGDKVIEKSGFGMAFGAGADYAFENSIGAFVDVRYANSIYQNATSADDSDNMTLGAGVTKGFSNGVFGVAFEGSTNGGGHYTLAKPDDFSWAIPVKVEYWF